MNAHVQVPCTYVILYRKIITQWPD
jgi:hypothetical protein